MVRATSVTINALRMSARVPSPELPRPEARNVELMSIFANVKAGARPNRTPVRVAMAKVKRMTQGSMEISESRGRLAGPNLSRARIASQANASPKMPPVRLRTILSTSN